MPILKIECFRFILITIFSIEGGEKSLKKKGWRSKRRVGGGSTSTSASSTGASSSSHAEPDSRSATISK